MASARSLTRTVKLTTALAWLTNIPGMAIVRSQRIMRSTTGNFETGFMTAKDYSELANTPMRAHSSEGSETVSAKREWRMLRAMKETSRTTSTKATVF